MANGITDIDLAYAAGFFDGEGYSGIRGTKTKTKRDPNGRFFLSCIVTQKDPAILSWLVLQFGGTIFHSPSQICPRWRVVAKVAENFLIQILPFLKLKKPQAELALEFRESFKTKGRGYYLTKNVIDFRAKCKTKMETLKRCKNERN